MRSLNLTVLLCLVSFLGHSQSYQIDIGIHEERSCEFDSTSTIDAYSKIRMYSTLNNEWDGPLDSSLCYSLVQVGNSWRFPSSTIPANRSAFFEMTLDSALVLDTSEVYMARPLLGAGCNSNGCETLHMVIDLPDSAGVDTVSIVLDLNFEDDFDQVSCFPTQKIMNQRVSGLIFEFTSVNSNSDFYIRSPSLEPHWEGTYIIPQFTQAQTAWGPNLLRYWHDVYPTEDSISYTDVLPWGNPTDSTLIQYYVEFFSSLHFQNHTALRGALVQGSDSIRHGLEVILEGNMCIPFYEVVWGGETHLVIDGGSIGMHGVSSCNQFGKGSSFTIKSGTEFHYGHNGVGMLALRTGAVIILEPNAELNIHGPVFMYEFTEDTEPQQLYMELPVGAKLTFGEGSSLSNQYSKDRTMKLNIYMRGGELDLSRLSNTEQNLINLIYDDPSESSWENLEIFPNPIADELQFVWIADGAARILKYEVFDMSGKLVAEKRVVTSNAGHNAFKVDLGKFTSGFYTLRLSNNEEILARRKFVKNGGATF